MSIEDRLAILEVIANYSYHYDGQDADAYAELFTEDGVFEVYAGREKPLVHNAGREAIRERAESAPSSSKIVLVWWWRLW